MGVQRKIGGKFHLKLNMDRRPIANKYREGKMQRTLKRELKVLEIVKREAIGISRFIAGRSISLKRWCRRWSVEGSTVASGGWRTEALRGGCTWASF